MDAWEQLIDGATIETGDAWTLLHAQSQGEVGEKQIIYVTEGMESIMTDVQLIAELQISSISATMVTNGTLSATINSNTTSAEIQDSYLSSVIYVQ